jgi:hypothetical protein
MYIGRRTVAHNIPPGGTGATGVVGVHRGRKDVNAFCPAVKGVGIDGLGISHRTAEQNYHPRQKQVSHHFHILI